MSAMRKIFNFLENLINIYVPVIAFLVLIIAFLLQIVFRYVFNAPLKWTYELTVIGYIWVALLGACFARKTNENVSFSMAYDSWSKKGQTIARIIGNLIILVTYVMLVYPAYEYVDFMKIKKTTVLRIPMNYIFMSFLIFVLVILIYTIIDLVKDFKLLASKNEADDKV